MKLKLYVLIMLLVVSVVSCRAAGDKVNALLGSILDGESVPGEAEFYSTVNDEAVNQMAPEAVTHMLSLAAKLLHDPRAQVQMYGLNCFVSVTLRRALDSESLIESFIPDLEKIADDHSNAYRLLALTALSNTQPKVSASTLAYFAAHLADSDNSDDDNSDDEVRLIACTLLMARSEPLTRQSLQFAVRQNHISVQVGVLNQLGLIQTDDPEGLKFISAGLDHSEAPVRLAAVNAVSRLPISRRDQFFPQLNRIIGNSNEMADIRSNAMRALR